MTMPPTGCCRWRAPAVVAPRRAVRPRHRLWRQRHTLADTKDGRDLGFTYYQSGWLVAVSDGGVEIARYRHNAAGQRVVKQAGLNRTHYLYDDGGRLVAEVDAATGAVLVEYMWLGGVPLATVFGGGMATYHVHADHLGTPQVLTDAGGRIVRSAVYRPFGETASAGGGGAAAFNLRFPGQYFDAETGLHYNGFRDYDPSTGRYVQSDPIGLGGGFNVYAYVGGNPMSYSDKLGLYEIFIGGLNDDYYKNVKNYSDTYISRNSGRNAAYYEWTQKSKIIALIREIRLKCGDSEPINLIGHSYGGDTAEDVISALGPGVVNLLVTVDPVSRWWSRSGKVSQNVGEWININATPTKRNLSDTVASLGGKWGNWPNGRADWHYGVDANHASFTKMMDAPFMGNSNNPSLTDRLANSPPGNCACSSK